MPTRRAAATPAPATDDPEPQPPPPLDLDACCGQGCDPCVFDLHEAALERYRVARHAWDQRHGRLKDPGSQR